MYRKICGSEKCTSPFLDIPIPCGTMKFSSKIQKCKALLQVIQIHVFADIPSCFFLTVLSGPDAQHLPGSKISSVSTGDNALHCTNQTRNSS